MSANIKNNDSIKQSVISNLHIIITDFNGYTQTQKCLMALSKSSYINFTTIVVDHGTTNETKENLVKDFPEVIRLEGSSTLWWAGANNLGIRYALKNGADAIMLINNDCYVHTVTIETLVCLSDKNPDSIIAPIQIDYKSKEILYIQLKCRLDIGFPTIRGPTRLTKKMKSEELLSTCMIIGGRGVIIPINIFDSIGYFDEFRLPHYCADNDFFLRAKKTNIKLYVSSNAFVDIDPTSSSLASRPELLSLKDFLKSFTDIRSHRNIKHNKELFKKHYPLPELYFIGLFLYILRYVMVYPAYRIRYLLCKGLCKINSREID